MPRFVGFIGPTYSLPSVRVDCQDCINLYAQIDELGTGKEKEVAALFRSPGLETAFTLPTSPFRGSWRAKGGTLYAVGGNKLYSISSSFVVSAALGTLNTSSGLVDMKDDGFNLVIVDGPNGYNYNFQSATFTQITDVNFLGSYRVSYIDGYFIFVRPDTQEFYISALASSSPTAPIAFDGDAAEAEGAPDNIVTHIATKRDLFLFGETTTEVWFDSGAAAFPFERMQGAFIEYGCAAKYSPARLANTVFWLGQDEHGDGLVVMANGYQPQRVSNHAVEAAIQGYDDISDAIGWAYQEDGHNFYVLNFPSADATWVFDAATSLWHKRAWTSNGILHRHRGQGHTFAYQTHLVGDWESGKVYRMHSSLLSDDGAAITRLRRAPHIAEEEVEIFHSEFQLDADMGIGLDGVQQGTDPQAMLRWSNDGGKTWSNEHWASLGKIGATLNRAKWTRLGMARDRVYEVTITDPVPVTLIGAQLQAQAGRS